MNLLKKVAFILVAAMLAASCAPLEEPESQRQYHSICNVIAKGGGGKISKQEFMAAAKNKEEAEKVYEMCDPNNTGYITEEVAADPTKVRMMQEVIRLTEPRPR